MLGGGLTCEPERMSGGAAVADVDGDGDLDLFVTRLDAPDILFRHRGNAEGKFEDMTAAGGLTTAAFTPGSGDTYYFLASIRNGNEGSYGQGRNDFERPQNTTACRIRALGTCD